MVGDPLAADRVEHLVDAQDEMEIVPSLVRVAAGEGGRQFAVAGPCHQRRAQKGELPNVIMKPRAVGIGCVQAEAVVFGLHAVPAAKRHLVGTGLAFHMSSGQATGPVARRSSELDGHLQHFVAFGEDHLQVQVNLGLARIDRHAQPDSRIAEDLIGEGPRTQGTGILHGPVESPEAAGDVLVETRLVEHPGVAVLLAEMQGDSLASQQFGAFPFQRRDSPGSGSYGEIATGDDLLIQGNRHLGLGRGEGGTIKQFENPTTLCGDFHREHRTVDHRTRVRFRNHKLERHRLAAFIGKPAVAPVVEVDERLALDVPVEIVCGTIEQHQTLHILAGQGGAGMPAGDSDDFLLADDTGPSLHVSGREVGGRHAGSRKDVVELREGQILPCLIDAGDRSTGAGLIGPEGPRELLRLFQQALATVLHLLDVVHHAVAAGKGFLQFVVDHRNRIAAGLGLDVEVIDGAEAQLDPLEGIAVFDQPLDVGLRRSAPVVAQSVEHHRMAEGRVGGLHC